MAILKSVAAAAYATGTTIVDPVNPVVVPNGAKGKFLCTLTMDQLTLDNVLTDVEVWVAISDDGTTWRRDAGMRFKGGPNQGKGGAATPNPGFAVNVEEYAGKQARGEIVNNALLPVTTGLLIERV